MDDSRLCVILTHLNAFPSKQTTNSLVGELVGTTRRDSAILPGPAPRMPESPFRVK